MPATPRNKFKTFLIHFYHGMSLFLMGAAATMCLTEIGKRWIGRLRPHFIDVCKPDMSQLNCTSDALAGSYYNPIYTGGSFCTGDPDQIKEARFSVGQVQCRDLGPFNVKKKRFFTLNVFFINSR